MRTGMQPSSWPRPSDQGLGQLVWQVLTSWQVYTAGDSSGAFLVLYCMVDLYSAMMVLDENTHHKRLTNDKRLAAASIACKGNCKRRRYGAALST